MAACRRSASSSAAPTASIRRCASAPRSSSSFGAMTLPHQLVRVLVLEQLYRGLTILAGHPYHRAG